MKLVALLAVLAAVSTSPNSMRVSVCALLLLAAIVIGENLPLLALLGRSALVLPFSSAFFVVSAIAGDLSRGEALVARSYTSAFATLLFLTTTPYTDVLTALGQLRMPRFLLSVLQLLYRYFFVLGDEGRSIRVAALSRGGFQGANGFQAAAGALSGLFARSHLRAVRIHQSMLSRGYQGALPSSTNPDNLRVMDILFGLLALFCAGLLRFGIPR